MMMTAEVCQLLSLLLGKRQHPTGRGWLRLGGNKSGRPFIRTDNNLPDNIKAIHRMHGVSFKARYNPQVDIMGWHFRSTGASPICPRPVRSTAGVICKSVQRGLINNPAICPQVIYPDLLFQTKSIFCSYATNKDALFIWLLYCIDTF